MDFFFPRFFSRSKFEIAFEFRATPSYIAAMSWIALLLLSLCGPHFAEAGGKADDSKISVMNHAFDFANMYLENNKGDVGDAYTWNWCELQLGAIASFLAEQFTVLDSDGDEILDKEELGKWFTDFGTTACDGEDFLDSLQKSDAEAYDIHTGATSKKTVAGISADEVAFSSSVQAGLNTMLQWGMDEVEKGKPTETITKCEYRHMWPHTAKLRHQQPAWYPNDKMGYCGKGPGHHHRRTADNATDPTRRSDDTKLDFVDQYGDPHQIHVRRARQRRTNHQRLASQRASLEAMSAHPHHGVKRSKYFTWNEKDALSTFEDMKRLVGNGDEEQDHNELKLNVWAPLLLDMFDVLDGASTTLKEVKLVQDGDIDGDELAVFFTPDFITNVLLPEGGLLAGSDKKYQRDELRKITWSMQHLASDCLGNAVSAKNVPEEGIDLTKKSLKAPENKVKCVVGE